MTTADILKLGSYFVANLAYTYVLVWGFRAVAGIFKEPVLDEADTSIRPQSAGLAMLSTPRRPASTPIRPASTPIRPASKPIGSAADESSIMSGSLDLSYAKVSGAIGSIAIAALFVGLSYFILFGLFFGTEAGINLGDQLNGLQIYFLAGAALFLPYAFESLTNIFKP